MPPHGPLSSAVSDVVNHDVVDMLPGRAGIMTKLEVTSFADPNGLFSSCCCLVIFPNMHLFNLYFDFKQLLHHGPSSNYLRSP